MKCKIFTFLLMIFIFTGCNKSELVCSKKIKNAGYVYNENYTLIYDDNNENLKQIDLTMKYSYNEHYTEEEIQDEFSKTLEYCNFYESESNKLIKCNATLDDNILNVDVKIKVNKVSNDLFENMMYVTKDEINNLNDTKKMLENVGYSCK